jgi:hypothetical protein
MRYSDCFVLGGRILRDRSVSPEAFPVGTTSARNALQRLSKVGDRTIWSAATGLELEVRRGLPIQISEDPDRESLAQARCFAFGERGYKTAFWMAVISEEDLMIDDQSFANEQAIEAIVRGSLGWGSPRSDMLEELPAGLQIQRPILVTTCVAMEGSMRFADLAGSAAVWFANAVFQTRL